MNQEKPLWICPKCGAKYVTRNSWHSCVQLAETDFLAGKGPRAMLLYNTFKAVVGRCGPFETHVTKTGLAFMVRVRFAGVKNLSEKRITCSFWLKRLLESPRFMRVDYPSSHDWIYYFRVTVPDEFDAKVDSWIKEAYLVGIQRNQHEMYDSNTPNEL